MPPCVKAEEVILLHLEMIKSSITQQHSNSGMGSNIVAIRFGLNRTNDQAGVAADNQVWTRIPGNQSASVLKSLRAIVYSHRFLHQGEDSHGRIAISF